MTKRNPHDLGRYCGNQMCCWGAYGKRAPKPKRKAKSIPRKAGNPCLCHWLCTSATFAIATSDSLPKIRNASTSDGGICTNWRRLAGACGAARNLCCQV